MNDVSAVVLGLLPAALRSATPLLWALLGETLTQRAGIVNLGTEGQMLVGAATAFGVTASTGNPWAGLVAGALAGAALSGAHALLCLRYRANQFASGIAVWMMGFGLSSYLGQKLVGQSIEGFRPVVGSLTPTILLVGVATVACGYFLYRTRPGLELRAVGESNALARAAGVRVPLVRTLSVVAGGLLSGIGGAALSIDYAQTWAEGMTKGRGLIAVGLVIVARWNPYLALPTALMFGGAEALVLRVQSAGTEASAHLLHMLPYLVALGVLIASCLRGVGSGAPAELRATLR